MTIDLRRAFIKANKVEKFNINNCNYLRDIEMTETCKTFF